jgi:ubiquinone/menaquinone biosynthesis C-methylase UbiE
MQGLRKDYYWSGFSKSYDEGTEYVVGKPLRQAVRARLLQEGDLGTLVEFGCGTGFFTEVIAEKAVHVLATDQSSEMLEVAGERLARFHNVTLQAADCRKTGFSSGNFDTVFVVNVLQTIDRPSMVLKEGRRILRSGGLLLVVSYTDYGLSLLEKMVIGIRYFTMFGLPPIGGIRNFSPPEMERLVEMQGFKILQSELIGGKPKAIYLKAKSTRRGSPLSK